MLGLLVGLEVVGWAGSVEDRLGEALSVGEGVVFEVRTKPYRVPGRTPARLRAGMNRRGPGTDEEPFDAYTTYHVAWSWEVRRSDAECRVVEPSVELVLTFVLPRPMRRLRGETLVMWEDYMEALIVHELGHARHGVAAAEEIATLLRGGMSAPSCGELAELADRRAHEVLDRFVALDEAYDLETEHGVTQGALFW